MKICGGICFLSLICGFIFSFPNGYDEALQRIDGQFILEVFAAPALVGSLFFLAARGIRKMERWGKRLGRFLALGFFVYFVEIGFEMFSFIFRMLFPPAGEIEYFFLLPLLFAVIMFAQFAAVIYFGVRYLGRLPAWEGATPEEGRMPEGWSLGVLKKKADDKTYRDSPLPFGLFGGFSALFLPCALIMVFTIKFMMFWLLPLFFLHILLVPVISNRLPSPFQKDRKPLASSTGGGST